MCGGTMPIGGTAAGVAPTGPVCGVLFADEPLKLSGTTSCEPLEALLVREVGLKLLDAPLFFVRFPVGFVVLPLRMFCVAVMYVFTKCAQNAFVQPTPLSLPPKSGQKHT